jgi:hypothetical protein
LGPRVVRELNDGRITLLPLPSSDPSPSSSVPLKETPSTIWIRLLSNGAVLSTVYLGQIVLAETGRKTWVGLASWTPDYLGRAVLSEELFEGELSPSATVDLGRSNGARFLLADCQSRANPVPLLHSILRSVRRFGCATIYIVRSERQVEVGGPR